MDEVSDILTITVFSTKTLILTQLRALAASNFIHLSKSFFLKLLT